jgi:hypothetical protein
VDRSLGRGWSTFERKLAERERRVPSPELCDFLQLGRELGKPSAATKGFDGPELFVRCAARADEVGVVGVGETVGASSSTGHDGALFEEQDRFACSGEGEDVGDRFEPFGVRDCVPPAVEDAESHSLFSGDAREELGAAGACAADLEMRCARSAQRASPEEGAPHIGGAAAGSGDDSSRRMFERREAGTDDSGLVQNLQGPVVSGNVQLVARSPVESSSPVGADLGGDAERAQEAEGAPRDGWIDDIEVNRDLATALQVLAAGGVEQPRELSEAVARAARRDGRQLVSEVLRE